MNINSVAKQDIFKFQFIFIFVLFVLFLLIIYLPLHKKITHMEHESKMLYEKLGKITLLENTYRSLIHNGFRTSSKDIGSDSLVSIVQKILKQTGIEENLISIVPSTRRLDNKNNEQFVDIKLEGLGLKEAVSFLERLHKINQIHITRLNIVRKNGEQATITLRILLKSKTIS